MKCRVLLSACSTRAHLTPNHVGRSPNWLKEPPSAPRRFRPHEILDIADLGISLRTVHFAFPRCGSVAPCAGKRTAYGTTVIGKPFALLLSLDSTITFTTSWSTHFQCTGVMENQFSCVPPLAKESTTMRIFCVPAGRFTTTPEAAATVVH